jgi:hypothetical protein
MLGAKESSGNRKKSNFKLRHYQPSLLSPMPVSQFAPWLRFQSPRIKPDRRNYRTRCDFEGVWKVKDTAGQPFEITLSGGGAAKASHGEGMVGTRKEEGKTAVINVEHGLDHEDRERGRSIQKTCLRQRPATGRSTHQEHGRAKDKVTALRPSPR